MPEPRLCRGGDSLLLVVDCQIRLAAAMPDAAITRLYRNGRVLLTASGQLNIPVLVTEQYSKGLGPTVPELADQIPIPSTFLEKTAFSCCGAEGFMDKLNTSGKKQIILMGMEAHVCVLQTALELAANGNEVFVVNDAVCSRDNAHVDNAIARLRDNGVTISNTESMVFEWLRDASHPDFKSLSALLR